MTIKKIREIMDAHIIPLRGSMVISGDVHIRNPREAIHYAKETICAEMVRQISEHVVCSIMPVITHRVEGADMKVTGEIFVLTAEQYHHLLGRLSREE